VSQAIKLANELRSIDKEVSQADLKLKVAELTGSLADIKLTLTEAKSEAAEKDEEIARLKKLQHRLAERNRRAYGYRYRKRKDGKEGGAGNPMCDVCLQKNWVVESRRLKSLEKASRLLSALTAKRSMHIFTRKLMRVQLMHQEKGHPLRSARSRSEQPREHGYNRKPSADCTRNLDGRPYPLGWLASRVSNTVMVLLLPLREGPLRLPTFAH